VHVRIEGRAMGAASQGSGSDAAAASRLAVQMRHGSHGSGHASGDSNQGLSCEEMPQHQQHAPQQECKPQQEQRCCAAVLEDPPERFRLRVSH